MGNLRGQRHRLTPVGVTLRRLLPAVDELMGEGLITMEKTHAVLYRGE